MNSFVEFEGKIVNPDKNGHYRCPFNCGDKRYPLLKWKTESGFKKHTENCPKRPSFLLEIEKIKQENDRLYNEKRQQALLNCLYKVGQKIFYIKEIILKDIYEWRGNKNVKMRYEQEKRFEAREDIIESIDYDTAVFFNNGIRINDLQDSLNSAIIEAEKIQKSYNEHVKLASSCR